MKFYGYWRSGTSHRVRLAIGHKGLGDIEAISVNLAEGDHLKPEFRAENPSAAVPLLVLQDGTRIGQSTAIIEYLEEAFPEAPLLPKDAAARARVRHLCQIIACDVHPLQNLRVQKYLKNELELQQSKVDAWLLRWLGDGLAAYEKQLELSPSSGAFSVGDGFTMAECFLLPQLFGARRFKVPLEAFPRILAVEKACEELDFVTDAAPEAQADAK